VEGSSGGGFFTRDPERYVKKGSDTGVSLLGGLFLAEGNLESGGSHIPETLKDE